MQFVCSADTMKDCIFEDVRHGVLQCVAVCCGVLQCVAVWCSVVQCGAVWCSVLQCVAVHIMCSVDTKKAASSRIYNRVLQCVAVCCSMFSRVLQFWRIHNMSVNMFQE